MLTYITENYFVCLLILTMALALAGVECLFSAQDREDGVQKMLENIDHPDLMQEQYREIIEAEIKKTRRLGYAFLTAAGVVLFIAFF